MSLVRLPRARSPSVEKKSSISFSRRRLRFSASSRARSEFLSLISSIRFLFLSCSISCSSLSICAHRAALDSSSLQRAEHRCVSGQYKHHQEQLLMPGVFRLGVGDTRATIWERKKSLKSVFFHSSYTQKNAGLKMYKPSDWVKCLPNLLGSFI